MAIQALNTIKKWFQTGLKPSQNQFWDTWDSFRHKFEKVPLEDVEELESILNAKAEKSELDEHKNDNTAHSELFATKEDKSQKGIALGYAPLDEFSKIAYQYLEIVDNLTSGGTTSMLSAEQGVVLQNQIDSIRTLLSSDNPKLDTFQKIADTIKHIQMSLDTILVNDLTTGGATKALTAEMGKQLEASKEDKSQKGVADGYVPLDDFAKIASQYLTIINDLTTGGSESILSAEQGIVLQNQIDSINTLLASDNVDLDTIQEIVDAIEQVQMSLDTILVNDLTTGGMTKALTAEMGKQLNEIKLTATIATDAETQITSAIQEDNKVVSRSKLFNWWNWIATKAQIIVGIWSFPNGLKSEGTTQWATDTAELKSTGFYVQSLNNGKTTKGSYEAGRLQWIDRSGYYAILSCPYLTESISVQFQTKSGTVAYINDWITTGTGTATNPPLTINNGVLTTVPRNGAIERDLDGKLYHTYSSIRKRLLDESDTPNFLQTTYRSVNANKLSANYVFSNRTITSNVNFLNLPFDSKDSGNYLLKTLDQYIIANTTIDTEFDLPTKIVFEFYLKGMNCKFGGAEKIRIYGMERTDITTRNSIRNYEIPLNISSTSDGTNMWSILSFEENLYDLKGNIIDTTYRSYPLQTFDYTGNNSNGNLKFNQNAYISFEMGISFFFEDSTNENNKNIIFNSSYTNASTLILKL